jgi:hypothetical protein
MCLYYTDFFLVGAYMVLFMQHSEGAITKYKYHQRSKYKKLQRRESSIALHTYTLTILPRHMCVTLTSMLLPKFMIVFKMMMCLQRALLSFIYYLLSSIPLRKRRKIRRSYNVCGQCNRPYQLKEVRYYQRCMVLCSLLTVVHGCGTGISKDKRQNILPERKKAEAFSTTACQDKNMMFFAPIVFQSR